MQLFNYVSFGVHSVVELCTVPLSCGKKKKQQKKHSCDKGSAGLQQFALWRE